MADPYQSLELGQIRVLKLKPAFSEAAPLEGVLCHQDLDSAEYDCLSYVWGSASPDDTTIDITYQWRRLTFLLPRSPQVRALLPIGSNLARALRQLRSKTKTITVWADALCINQSDVKEKSNQVRLMTRIYERAMRVHACLGPRYQELPATESSMTGAFEIMKLVEYRLSGFESAQRLENDLFWLNACLKLSSFSVRGVAGQVDEADPFCAAFTTVVRGIVQASQTWDWFLSVMSVLSHAKYFSRIWILQECVKAKNQVFHYGRFAISRSVVFLSLCLARGSLNESSLRSPMTPRPNFDMRFVSCLTMRRANSMKEILKLTYFSRALAHDATNPHDLIFGLIGLSRQKSDHTQLPIDYERPIEEVFTIATELILSQGFTDSLVTIIPYSVRATLPSWALDWASRGSLEFARYRACGETQPQLNFPRSRPDAMCAQGCRIGGIRATGTEFSVTAQQAGFSKDAIATGLWDGHNPTLSQAELTDRILTQHRCNGSNVSAEDVANLFDDSPFPAAMLWLWYIIWMSSVWRFVLQEAPNLDEYAFRSILRELRSGPVDSSQDAFRSVLRKLRSSQVYSSQDGFASLTQYSSASTSKELADLTNLRYFRDATPQGLRVLQVPYRHAWGLRPIALDSEFIGYAPEDAAITDNVVILHGVKAPLVLRRVEDGTYTIIGPAYICGAMQGQFMDSAARSTKYVLV